MISLTEEQQHALGRDTPPRLIDPRTNTTYVLISEAAFKRMLALIDDDAILATAEQVDRVMRDDDDNDPHLAEYQRL